MENISLEVSDKPVQSLLSNDNLPVYYKYRYTFVKDLPLTEQMDQATDIVRYILKNYSVDGKLTAGIEHYTKGMEVCKPHLHVHFKSKIKSDTIRKSLANQNPSFFIGRCQACKAEVLVDEDKFWRYPLKQQKNDTRRYIRFSGFTQEEIEKMRDVAYACWKQSAEVSVAKQEKKEEKSSKDRLYIYLDTEHQLGNLTSLSLSIRLAYQYYVENEPTFSHSTIEGYVHSYLLSRSIISYKDYFEYQHPEFRDIKF